MLPNLLDVFCSVEQLEIMLLYPFVLWIFSGTYFHLSEVFFILD